MPIRPREGDDAPMGEPTGGVPLCFVLMPFGRKADPAGGPDIDFEGVWSKGLEPGIRAAGMEPVRADLEQIGGVIHRAMFERLLLCDFAVADLTTANANVFYELGIRHAAVPATTLPIIAARHRIPFDVHAVRALTYQLGEDNEVTDEVAGALSRSVETRLRQLRELAGSTEARDSPLFELVRDWRPPRLAREKTDVFWQEVRVQRGGQEAARARAPSRQDHGSLRGGAGASRRAARVADAGCRRDRCPRRPAAHLPRTRGLGPDGDAGRPLPGRRAAAGAGPGAARARAEPPRRAERPGARGPRRGPRRGCPHPRGSAERPGPEPRRPWVCSAVSTSRSGRRPTVRSSGSTSSVPSRPTSAACAPTCATRIQASTP